METSFSPHPFDGMSTRRQFLASSVVMAAAAATGGCCHWCHRPPRKCCLHVRRRLSSWTEQDYGAYRQAVTVMQSRPLSDPTSWLFQANIHGRTKRRRH
jgi:hypothetical protein